MPIGSIKKERLAGVEDIKQRKDDHVTHPTSLVYQETKPDNPPNEFRSGDKK